MSGVVVVVDEEGGGGESHRRGWNITPPNVKECCLPDCPTCADEEEGGKRRETKGSKLRNGKWFSWNGEMSSVMRRRVMDNVSSFFAVGVGFFDGDGNLIIKHPVSGANSRTSHRSRTSFEFSVTDLRSELLFLINERMDSSRSACGSFFSERRLRMAFLGVKVGSKFVGSST